MRMSRWNKYEELIQQGDLPILKVAPVENILLHEHVETDRAEKLRDRIEQSGMIQNPLICVKLNDTDKYILLDGAHRFTALNRLKCRFAPIQIVNYDDPLLEVKKWRHLFNAESEEAVIERLQFMEDVKIRIESFDEDVRFHQVNSKFYTQVILKSGKSVLLTGSNDLNRKIEVINTFSSLYLPDNIIDRISYDDFNAIRTHYDEFTGLVVYPRFSKKEICKIALNSEKLPTGITRHLIPKRALHVNLPLSMLRFTKNQEEVESFLMDNINQKIRNKSIRFYTESTFLFDD